MKEYDVFRLTKDLNPTLPKGSVGTILIKYSDNEYEVEFVRSEERISNTKDKARSVFQTTT